MQKKNNARSNGKKRPGIPKGSKFVFPRSEGDIREIENMLQSLADGYAGLRKTMQTNEITAIAIGTGTISHLCEQIRLTFLSHKSKLEIAVLKKQIEDRIARQSKSTVVQGRGSG